MALCLSSCDDFLDVQPEGNTTTTTYFTNDQQSIDAVNGLYQPTHQEGMFGRELFWEQGAANDIVWGRTRSFPTLATMKYTGDESPIRGSYSTFYTIMARANYIIKSLLAKGQLTEVETRSLGESYFMRAFAHFWIAHRYGTDELGVPFVRWEDFEGEYDNSIPPQRESVMENYRLIVEDLDMAINYLPRFEEYGAEDQGRAHKAAALGYKAKAYAYWATWDETKWGDVITCVNQLESDYGRGLADTFAEVFTSDKTKFWNREYIWTIPSDGGAVGGGLELPGVMLENKGWGIYNGWGQIKPSNDIYEEMLKDGAGNDRIVKSMLAYGQKFMFFGSEREFFSSSDLDSGFQIYKYQEAFGMTDDPIGNGYVNANGDWPTVRINFPLLRMAELILFRAEAYLMQGNGGQAAADINRVRTRSNLTPLPGAATMADLYHERRCELAFEYSNHLFDLKRWHRSSNAEIKALAAAELNARPTVRYYEDRNDPASAYSVDFYSDYQDKLPYQDYMMTFPYPSQEVIKSNGQLKQLSGWQ
ncbi:MAG: RagB/SusD family nutrient uptake outer membrane protein [Muribaculaceae bacterium]|nr:RagB/SusD family nutrient uptake outer membrane protein [Muribaculaceae bacterium]